MMPDVVAMVALKNHDRAAVQLQPFEQREQLAQVAIHRVNGGVIVPVELLHLLAIKSFHVGDRWVQVFEQPRVLLRHRRIRQVRFAEVDQGGKGLVLVGFDPAHGVVHHDVGAAPFNSVICPLTSSCGFIGAKLPCCEPMK